MQNTDKIKKAIRKIEALPEKEQEDIARLILEELSWNHTLETTQDNLAALAKEANMEYKSRNV
jgi:hypothetical protein